MGEGLARLTLRAEARSPPEWYPNIFREHFGAPTSL
jgi:hypothetical protein